jgi:dipeptidyl aminopeptidase/acylaminoacyl peptidase
MRDPETEDEEQRKKEKRDVILVDQNFKFAHLYTVDVDQGGKGARDTRRLTSGSFHVSSFDWSPDGRSIVFAHQPDPRINTSFISGDIAVVPADSGAVTQLVTLGGREANPQYSPDGQWVAFTGTGDEPERIGLADVYVVPALGGAPRKLADTPDRSASLLGWSSDGSEVLVSEALGVERHVLAVPLDGSPPRQVTTGEGVLGSVSFDATATRIAFTFQTTDTPPDVFVSAVDSFAMTQISDVHGGVPRPPMGRTEVLNWTSNDGMAVEGLLTYPVDYEEGRQYPLVLNVHGGPSGVFSRSFTGSPSIYMIQTFAQRGYAVLRPNPRGSTGYGKDFRYANFRDWGYGDFDDLLSGVDHVIDLGVAHGDSLLLMGWSYGGYMTSFAVTRTDRFRAASMGAGLPNLVSMVTTTDIDDYLFGHMGAEFWDDYEVYERHSAIYRIKEVTTPTQVIHGAEDLRVPFTQGQEFYRALSRRGVPTEMIVYPRTPHGPREPKFLMDVTSRILTWFERYLRPERPATDDAMDDMIESR